MSAELLEQSKLDVADKNRSNIFNWRGQFTPQFIEYLVDAFARPGALIVDPFCGSGTVLLEAAARQIPAAGYEINPAAYAMSKFICFASVTRAERADLFQHVSEQIHRLSAEHSSLPLFGMSDNFHRRYKNLVGFAIDLFAQVNGKTELLLALIVMMRAEMSGSKDLCSALQKASLSVSEDLLRLPFSEEMMDIQLCDARDAHTKYSNSADLIITSPPYINVFNYHQNHRALLEVIGFDMLKVAESEIGSNRKNRANRFRTVIQYALDMEQCLCSFCRTLAPGGSLVMIVGHESNVRGVPFGNSAIIRDLAKSLRCFRLDGERHRIFVNRFGKAIREDILVMTLTGEAPAGHFARQVAKQHLEDALGRTHVEPREDILAALSDIPSIAPSPILCRKGLFDAPDTAQRQTCIRDPEPKV